MLGLSAEAWGGIGTIIGTMGAGASFIVSRINVGDKRAHDLEMTQITDGAERLDASLKKAWDMIDDLRLNTVRRQEQDKLREELRADMKVLGDRLEVAIMALRDDIHRGGK